MASKQIMDGCTAATHVAYALSEVATIYPITPIASMGETADKWAAAGRTGLTGQPMQVQEMESELGAAGAVHGALVAGALATTFTASQGLLLMIPNMYKIAGEQLPAVFHVGTRSLATHALSIFGDHQDVMACRATGFAMLASSSVQETMDLALVAHLAAIDGSLPVLHFFDGWRTSNEMATIDVIAYEDMRPLVDWDKVKAFRDRAMNPCHPEVRGSCQNPDVYFQNAEAANRYYDAFPSVVQAAMDRVGKLTGRHYSLFGYEGHPEAEHVIVTMGSSAEVAAETVAALNAAGYRVGVVKVRLFRPFDASAMLAALPPTIKRIAVLDRTKEPGSQGEPLYLDVVTAVHTAGLPVEVIGGRYGLSSKDFTPAMVKAVFDNLAAPAPRRRFTVGINDDVTHLSLDYDPGFSTDVRGLTSALFYGMGSDGSVGATKIAASILSDTGSLYAQAYFNYSAKKSGGYTISELRFSQQPIHQEYSVSDADYLACNKSIYVKRFDMIDRIHPGGIFVLNSSWDLTAMENHLPADMRRAIARRKIAFYNIDANAIAARFGLGVRINTIMLTVFLKLVPVVDFDTAMKKLREMISDRYMHEGGDIVERNLSAVQAAAGAISRIVYPDSWADAEDTTVRIDSHTPIPEFIEKIHNPCMRLEGNTIPVSLLTPDGTMPMGTTACEKRSFAIDVPQWIPENCVECTECSFVCPHAAIRPVVMNAAEAASAPAQFTSRQAVGSPVLKDYRFRIQVYVQDCTGCGSCTVICPGHALPRMPLASQEQEQIPLLEWAQKNVAPKENLLPRDTVNGSQFRTPLMQFSGACAGCGETPYVKLLTQLFGERMLVANATGCSSVWGANFPSNAYCVNEHGEGPAWGNSLFEDNAEYGLGIALATAHRRRRLAIDIETLASDNTVAPEVRSVASDWLKVQSDATRSGIAGRILQDVLRSQTDTHPLFRKILRRADLLQKKSVWAIGGDGWAYDIGFAGLDHVLAQDIDINILVMDTECYSNTGGQPSKATPFSAVTPYSTTGKRTCKKDLGRMMMSYGNIYVAQIAMGANYQQTIDALTEAEAYPGPSLVIAYCPCIEHGIRKGMSHSIVEERRAVECGYWPIYRYNPAVSPHLRSDSPAPDAAQFDTFINGEDRYADLRISDPADADALQTRLRDHAISTDSAIAAQATERSPQQTTSRT